MGFNHSMSRKLAVLAAFAAGFAGCEQATQSLPFDVEAPAPRMVGSQGGTVSTPAGASIHIPAGAVAGAVGVSVTHATVPSQIASSGDAVSGAFRIEPAGLVLSRPAPVEVRLSTGVDPSRAWLATLVTMPNGRVRESGSSRVDLRSGVVTADVAQLGTVAVVIPAAGAVFPVRSRMMAPARALGPLSSAQNGTWTDSVSVSCGNPENRCSGMEVTASQNILDQIEDAAVIYPAISGVLRRDAAGAAGALHATASLRIRLQSGQTAESMDIVALLRPTPATVVIETATEIRFTDVHHRIGGTIGGEAEAQEEVTTLVIPKQGGSASIAIRRSFQIRTAGGKTETAEISLVFPVQLHP
jgi:hypothetical protein